MDATMIDEHLENIDRRLERLEQILPTLATKDELKTMATKEELRTAVEPLATKEELWTAVAPLATRAELRSAVADAVAPLATREELREEGERSRRHMTMLIEHQDSKLELLAEHLLKRKPSKE
jgi:hypothetical protein